MKERKQADPPIGTVFQHFASGVELLVVPDRMVAPDLTKGSENLSRGIGGTCRGCVGLVYGGCFSALPVCASVQRSDDVGAKFVPNTPKNVAALVAYKLEGGNSWR